MQKGEIKRPGFRRQVRVLISRIIFFHSLFQPPQGLPGGGYLCFLLPCGLVPWQGYELLRADALADVRLYADRRQEAHPLPAAALALFPLFGVGLAGCGELGGGQGAEALKGEPHAAQRVPQQGEDARRHSFFLHPAPRLPRPRPLLPAGTRSRGPRPAGRWSRRSP